MITMEKVFQFYYHKQDESDDSSSDESDSDDETESKSLLISKILYLNYLITENSGDFENRSFYQK